MSDELDALIASYGNDFSRLEADLAARKRSIRNAEFESKRPTNAQVVLSARELHKTYKMGSQQVHAVADVSFDVHQGEMLALTGPSGSGKSTVLNVLSGLDRPDSGSVTIDGTNVSTLNRNQMSAFRAKHIGFVFQFFYLQPFLTLRTNVGVPSMFLKEGQPTKQQRNAQASQLINAVGLSDRAQHLPKQLSGGQLQRSAIARALMNKPGLILADEPTGNLDSANAQGIMDLFNEIRATTNAAVVVVTHDPAIAGQADRVIEMRDGKVA